MLSVIYRSILKTSDNLRLFFNHRVARAIGLTFAADSLLFGSWVTHIPHVKTALGLNDAQLGLALFGLPLGLLAMNPMSARLLRYFGLVNTTVWATTLLAIAFILPVCMPERWSLMAALFVTGLCAALLNVAMNTCATHVEQSEGIYIMSSCHGMWSMGGMVGSAVSAVLIALSIAPPVHLFVLSGLIVAGTWLRLRHDLRVVPDQEAGGDHSVFIWPGRDLLLLIFIGLCISLAEGVAFDWSAVYLRDVLGAPAQVAALAFTGFSMTMMAMRFTGDVLIPRFGERPLLRGSILTAVAAITVLIGASSAWAGLTGFLLLGAGVALGAPILFNAAARVPGLGPGVGLATYATFSFVGFLAGPPVIGIVGEAYGLWVGFVAVAGLLLLSVAALQALSFPAADR